MRKFARLDIDPATITWQRGGCWCPGGRMAHVPAEALQFHRRAIVFLPVIFPACCMNPSLISISVILTESSLFRASYRGETAVPLAQFHPFPHLFQISAVESHFFLVSSLLPCLWGEKVCLSCVLLPSLRAILISAFRSLPLALRSSKFVFSGQNFLVLPAT